MGSGPSAHCNKGQGKGHHSGDLSKVSTTLQMCRFNLGDVSRSLQTSPENLSTRRSEGCRPDDGE